MKKFLLLIIGMLFLISCFENTKNLQKENRVFRSNSKYYVYYEGNTFELPADLNLTKEKKVNQYFTKGFFKTIGIEVLNKSELLKDLNKYFPNGIRYVSKNEKLESKITNIPEMLIDGQKYIDSVNFEKILANLESRKQTVNTDTTETNTNSNVNETLKGKKIGILNANEISGFAKNIGEKIKAKFGTEYISENYDKKEAMTYVVVRNMSNSEVESILEESGVKYAQILENSTLKPELDFILITGDTEATPLEINIIPEKETSVLLEKLSGYKPKVDKTTKFSLENGNNIEIVYNPKDIFTAKIIAKKIGENVKFTANEQLNGKINIITNK